MTRINPLIFIKTAKEKQTLKEMKKEINSKLVSTYGSKRVGNKQFTKHAKFSLV